MSQHHVTTSWEKDSNQHEVFKLAFEDGGEIVASTDPASDSTHFLDPEQAYVASLSNCHMLSFLAEAAKKGLAVNRYVDHAVGFLGKNEEGRIAVTRVILRPSITFAGTTVSESDLDELHKTTHKNCFIANSVKTKIEIQPE